MSEQLNDGYGHTLDSDDSTESLLKELVGMFGHDKHEQLMDSLQPAPFPEAIEKAHELQGLKR
jgi:hypothetical protein